MLLGVKGPVYRENCEQLIFISIQGTGFVELRCPYLPPEYAGGPLQIRGLNGVYVIFQRRNSHSQRMRPAPGRRGSRFK